MSIKKLIEQTHNERMTKSEKLKKLNEFFENSEADKLLQELKKLDLLEDEYTDIIDMGWDKYRISIYRDQSIIIDRFDKSYNRPWRLQMATTFDGDVSTVNLLESNVDVKDMLDALKIAFFGKE